MPYERIYIIITLTRKKCTGDSSAKGGWWVEVFVCSLLNAAWEGLPAFYFLSCLSLSFWVMEALILWENSDGGFCLVFIFCM